MNLALGSTYDNKLLDMFEFEVTNYIPIEYFAKDVEVDSCMKPIIIFQGEVFETDFQYDRLRKYLLDLFRLHDIDEVEVTDLKRIMIVSAAENKEIHIRSYQIDSFNQYNVNKNFLIFYIVQRETKLY
jgi:ribosome production factor 2